MIPAFHRRDVRSRRSLNGVQGFSMNVPHPVFPPIYVARSIYSITKHDYKSILFLNYSSEQFSRLKISSSSRYTFSLKKHRFNRWDVSFEIIHCLKKKKKNRCGSRLERKVGWNNVRFRLKRWLNKRFPRDYLPAGTAPVNACNTRVDDAAAAATNLVRVPCWVKGMWRVCVLETWIEVQRVGELLGKCMTAGRRRRGGG